MEIGADRHLLLRVCMRHREARAYLDLLAPHSPHKSANHTPLPLLAPAVVVSNAEQHHRVHFHLGLAWSVQVRVVEHGATGGSRDASPPMGICSGQNAAAGRREMVEL